MKSLKPSMRENKRYLIVKGDVENVEKAILEFIGVLGMSKTGMSWIKKGKENGILCVNREAVDAVRASLVVWEKKIEVLKVSGTLKGLGREKAHKYL